MAQQCIWAASAGRSGNVHVSGSSFNIGPAGGFDRAAVCDACGATVGVFIDGQWFNVLRGGRGRQSYEKAPFAQFGEQRKGAEGSDSSLVGKKVRV